MILGLGSDICDIRRIESAIARHGERFLTRVFTDLERAKAAVRAEVVRNAADPESLASLLAVESLAPGAVDPRRLADECGAITGSALRETAAALFKPGRRKAP